MGLSRGSGSNARPHIFASFAASKMAGNKKTLPKSLKIRPSLEGEALNIENLLKSSYLFTSDFITSYFVSSRVSYSAFFGTSLRKRFVLIQIFKALATGCVDRCEHNCRSPLSGAGSFPTLNSSRAKIPGTKQHTNSGT